MKPSNVSIIIPAFNEEKVIGSVVSSIRSAFPESEIIVVNDGSTDNTAGEIAGSGVIVLNHDHNRGYGASLKTGIRSATRDYVLFCDGDGQHRIEDIKKLMESCDGYNLVVGARNSDSHQPLLRRPGKFIMKKFAEFLAGTKIPDLNSGLRIFKKHIVEKFLNIIPDGFSLTTTVTLALMSGSYKVLFIPINYNQRQGKSKIRPFYDTMDFLTLILRTILYFNPLKIFMPVGLSLILISAIFFVFRLIEGGGHTVIIPMFLLAGIQVLAIGMLADVIGRWIKS